MTVLAHDHLAELVDWLDDRGLRYEVLDGSVVVTPPATFRHESLVPRVIAALVAACPPGLVVMSSSYAVRYDPADDLSFLLPDVSVVHEATAQEDGTRVAPLLVVEVLSRTTRRRDLLVKREVYAELGVPSYWLVEQTTGVVTVLSLRDGAYEEVAAGTRLELTEPYDVVVDLA